ncbi:MAG: hypothetical protein LUO82_02795 [Methanomicrobiales archaeon]|nr:hypothetical protein [Methanomicrobiales archaeon]
MGSYKRIEQCIAHYIAPRYRQVVEVGVGGNYHAAWYLASQGVKIICTDRAPRNGQGLLTVYRDDIFHPREELYRGADLIYAIRPGVEMVPPLIALAQRIGADLLVYHPGDELYGNGGEVVECGVPLHRYHPPSRT